MRAFIRWLALAPLLVFAGCSSLHQTPRAVGFSSDISLSPSDVILGEALAHYGQALILEASIGASQSAIYHFRQAAILDPANIPLSLKVAADYIGRKDYPGAISVLEGLIISDQESIEVHLLLGSVYQMTDRSKEAVRQFRSAIRLAPERPEGYIRLATLLVLDQGARQALDVVKDGLRKVHDPQPLVDFCVTAGRLLAEQNDIMGATSFFRQALVLRPDDAPSRAVLARCYVVSGLERQALKEVTLLQEKHPDSAIVAFWLGELYELMGQRTLALEAYTRAGRFESFELLAMLRKAKLEMLVEPGAALITLRDLLHDHPDDLRVRIYLALIHMQLEQYDEALSQFDEVARRVEQDPQHSWQLLPLFYFWYGSACERGGRFEEGEQHLCRYLAANPAAAEALNYLAYMWAERGIKLAQAEAYIIKALALEPHNGAFLDTQAWIHFKRGDYSNAYKILKLALRQTGDDPVVFEHLGDVCDALKDSRDARKWWLKSLKLSPENRSVRGKLSRAGVDMSGIGY